MVSRGILFNLSPPVGLSFRRSEFIIFLNTGVPLKIVTSGMIVEAR